MLQRTSSRSRNDGRHLTSALLGTCLACVLAGTALTVDAADDDEAAPSSSTSAAQPKLKLKLSKPPIAAPKAGVHIKHKDRDKLHRSKLPAQRRPAPKPPTRATDTAPSARPKAAPRVMAPRRAPHRGSGAPASHTPRIAVPHRPPVRAHRPPRSNGTSPPTGLKAPARKPSGTPQRRGGFAPSTGASRPKYDSSSDTFQFGDGTRVRAKGPDGQRGRVNKKGDIVYGDGTIVTHDDATGETNVIRPDGSHTTYGRGRGGGSSMAGKPKYDRATGTYEYPDGTRVAGRDPKGRRGRVTDKGDIYYKDGTMVTHDGASGDTTVIHPDGSTSTYHGDGSRTEHDARSGTTVTFGARDSRTEYGSSKDKDTDSKDDGGGSGSSDSSSGSSDTGGSDTSSSSSDGGKDSDSSDDDGKDSDSSSDSGDDGKDSDSGKDDGGKDDGGDAEKLYGGSGGTAGPGTGPTAVVRDKLERMRDGRDRDNEGGGQGRCGPMSRPGPDGRCQESVGGSRPSAEPGQPIRPFDTRPHATRGRGVGPDCFDPAGCKDVGDRPARTSPMDRRPVTDPSPE